MFSGQVPHQYKFVNPHNECGGIWMGSPYHSLNVTYYPDCNYQTRIGPRQIIVIVVMDVADAVDALVIVMWCGC